MQKQNMERVAFARKARQFATICNWPPILTSTVRGEAAWRLLLELYLQADGAGEPSSAVYIAQAIDLPLTQTLRLAMMLHNVGLVRIEAGTTVADLRIGLGDLGHVRVDAILASASAVFSAETISAGG